MKRTADQIFREAQLCADQLLRGAPADQAPRLREIYLTGWRAALVDSGRLRASPTVKMFDAAIDALQAEQLAAKTAGRDQ